MGRILSLYLVSIVILGTVCTGCQQTCSTIPNQSLASVRIVNAVSNAKSLNVYIDGKWFGTANYDTNSFGYQQTFHSGGLGLTAGTHQVLAVVAGSRDTIVSSNIAFIDHRQTIVFIGRYHGTFAQQPQIKFLDDETRTSENSKNYIRFLEAVPDMNGVDVYFSNSIELVGGKPKPDLSLSYSEISDNHGGGTGTGRSANDYISIPLGTGLIITAKGDTSNKLFTFPLLSTAQGFLATLIVQGENQPIDNEPSVGNIAIFDGKDGTGQGIGFPTYSISLANATRQSPLNLLISSSNDQNPLIPRSPDNTPFPDQNNVLYIPSGSVGVYMPLTPVESNPADTLFNFWLSPTIHGPDTVYHFIKTYPHENERYTFVALDTMPLGFTGNDYSELTLFDTTGTPAATGYGRIRFVNASPDHVLHFTFAGKAYSMKQRDVVFADTTVGSYSITVSDGAKSATISFNVLSRQPITVLFLPATSANDFPYTVVER